MWNLNAADEGEDGGWVLAFEKLAHKEEGVCTEGGSWNEADAQQCTEECGEHTPISDGRCHLEVLMLSSTFSKMSNG